MGIFDNLKKNNSVVWRDSTGKITCLGDDCAQACDDTCPIWCQTMAITMMRMGQNEKAIEEFKKALALAPDFKDAWVNLAAIYGGMNNHMEANKVYKAAYAIDQNYKNALFGLIISCKNLGQFDIALKYCDEYAQKFSQQEAAGLREQVHQMQQSGKVSRQESALDMAVRIIEHARQEDLLGPNDHFPNIPEIMVEAKNTCSKIFQDLIKKENGRNPSIWFAWGAYAGMGAVYHWNINWGVMKAKGIAETLLEPRGSFAMDEYVLDSIGIPFESQKGKELGQNIYNLAMWTFVEFVNDASRESAMSIAMEAMQAMFIFGMVFEMERLGMK